MPCIRRAAAAGWVATLLGCRAVVGIGARVVILTRALCGCGGARCLAASLCVLCVGPGWGEGAGGGHGGGGWWGGMLVVGFGLVVNVRRGSRCSRGWGLWSLWLRGGWGRFAPAGISPVQRITWLLCAAS